MDANFRGYTPLRYTLWRYQQVGGKQSTSFSVVFVPCHGSLAFCLRFLSFSSRTDVSTIRYYDHINVCIVKLMMLLDSFSLVFHKCIIVKQFLCLKSY